MPYRLRAHLRFQTGNGMTGWAHAQNDVRLGQAYHLNEGAADEERSKHSAVADVYDCDLIYPGQVLAQDTWATLAAVAIPGYLRPPTEQEWSWMDLHECVHDVGGPCPDPTQAWDDQVPAVAEWVQPTGAHDAYALGAVVTYQGKTWRSTVAGNVWAPTVFGWVEV